jgi:sugar-specific transcriptional regulator TrmB
MDSRVLEDIGLTQGEIKVYLALLEAGTSTAGRIIEKAKIQNSVFHFCINRLIEKGLVSYVKKSKFRLYSSASPDNLVAYLKDKEKMVASILPELKQKQNKTEEQAAEIFEGIKGMQTMLNELIENTRAGDKFYFFAVDVPGQNEEIQEFFEMYDAKRRDKKLDVKGLATKENSRFFLKRKGLKVRIVDFPIPSNISICNNKMALITWGEKPSGILIKSKQIIDKQIEFFNSIWKQAKP